MRLFILGLLALSLLIKPVLASFGEMHELAHDPSGQHGHVDGPVATEYSDLGDRKESSDSTMLHALLHFAHCCGQSAAVTFSAASLLPPLRQGENLLPADVREHASTPSVTPFRPPITG